MTLLKLFPAFWQVARHVNMDGPDEDPNSDDDDLAAE